MMIQIEISLSELSPHEWALIRQLDESIKQRLAKDGNYRKALKVTKNGRGIA